MIIFIINFKEGFILSGFFYQAFPVWGISKIVIIWMIMFLKVPPFWITAKYFYHG